MQVSAPKSMTDRCVFASAKSPGARHLDRCEDSILVVQKDGWFIAAVADGAGSADRAAEGSALAVSVWHSVAPHAFASENPAEEFLNAFLAAIPAEADRAGLATTFLGFVAHENNALFLQLGDGAGVVFQDDFEVLVPPPHHEFVNVTQFLTDPDALTHFKTVRISCPQRLALFSDGLQYLVLSPDDQPHRPFFEAVFRTLKSIDGEDSASCEWLAQMLKSNFVTDKTDDDTSVVIAKFGELP